ncbi:MAG: ATP-binding protein [Bilophila wadsworthia]
MSRLQGCPGFCHAQPAQGTGKNGVNSPGTPEIPEQVFEELLVNALVHRDYLVSAPIRIFIFDDRVEIISPGTLPNNLTIANIKAGNSNIRNPILISYAAKGLLPYHGIGSGILRALKAWPDIDLKTIGRVRCSRPLYAEPTGLRKTLGTCTRTCIKNTKFAPETRAF